MRFSFFQFKKNDPINFPSICEGNTEPIPDKKINKETRNFNKYGPNFLYQHKVIKKEATVSEVLDAIMEDLESIEKHSNKK